MADEILRLVNQIKQDVQVFLENLVLDEIRTLGERIQALVPESDVMRLLEEKEGRTGPLRAEPVSVESKQSSVSLAELLPGFKGVPLRNSPIPFPSDLMESLP